MLLLRSLHSSQGPRPPCFSGTVERVAADPTKLVNRELRRGASALSRFACALIQRTY